MKRHEFTKAAIVKVTAAAAAKIERTVVNACIGDSPVSSRGTPSSTHATK
jgi:hypothetical protein